MKKQPKAIVLGGVSAHIPLIQNLKERGYHTVLVDYNENAPAKDVADEQIVESTLDQEKVLNIAKGINADLVINTCLDQPIPIACYVSEKLGLPVPYSYETALNVTNKTLMKKKMIEGGIPTAKYITVDGSTELNVSALEFPVIVKPADSTGSLGINKARNLTELNSFIFEALKMSKTNKAIIEEFKEGIELNVYCFIQNNSVDIIMMGQRLKMIDYGNPCMQHIGSITPADISLEARSNIKQIAIKTAHAFNLRRTPLLIQVIVNGGDVYVIECAARVGGSLGYRMIKLSANFDIINATVDSFLGIQSDLKHSQSEFYYGTNLVYSLPGVFGYITGYEELINHGVIEEFHILKTRGMEIVPGVLSRAKVGAFIVKADNKQDLFRKIGIAINQLEVYDIVGNPMMKRDVFLGKRVQ